MLLLLYFIYLFIPLLFSFMGHIYDFLIQQTDNLIQQCIQVVLNLFTGPIQEIIFVQYLLSLLRHIVVG